jgi:hypothetical protein
MPTKRRLTCLLILCYCCVTVKTRSAFYFYAFYFYGRQTAPLLAFE